jgi:hypothetical protein
MAAGRAARTLAWITGNIFGEWAVQSGCWARARTILEEAGEDRPERGWVPIIRALSEPDAKAREALLRDAVTIARRGGDPDVEFEALMLLGGLLLMTDRVEEGLAASCRPPGAGARPRPSARVARRRPARAGRPRGRDPGGRASGPDGPPATGILSAAAAALAKGRICLAGGQGDAAACLQEALAGFGTAGGYFRGPQ